jgi:hypothetical protein
MMLSGTGTVNVKTAVNDATTLSAATSVAMGTSRCRHRTLVCGHARA